MSNTAFRDKKTALLAQKQKILEEIKYYEKRIEDESVNKNSSSYFEDESSDSDSDIVSLDFGPSITQLKLQRSVLQTRLQATQELTSLQVLESEVNHLVVPPENNSPAKEPGVWREVTVECKVDLVPFSMIFNTFQPSRTFSSTSYRNLQVIPVKRAHELELAKSVLPSLRTPSDAVEVIRSYANAHRSRRNTLARLSETFANTLQMEQNPEGGYKLKCSDLLQMSWSLQNKRSPIAPFHHKLIFNLEYMDESYLKIINQAYRQLSDPSVDTEERTMLLTKIINTCLEAQGPTKELYESMESDPEIAKEIPALKNRRSTLDQELEEPVMVMKIAPDVMPPPKSLPKKTKPKGKENKSVKRSIEAEERNAKRFKTGEVGDLVDKNDKTKDLNVDKNDKTIDSKAVNKEKEQIDVQKDTTLAKNNKTKVDKAQKEIQKEGNGKKKEGSEQKKLPKDVASKENVDNKRKSVAANKKVVNNEKELDKEVLNSNVTVNNVVEKQKTVTNKDQIKKLKATGNKQSEKADIVKKPVTTTNNNEKSNTVNKNNKKELSNNAKNKEIEKSAKNNIHEKKGKTFNVADAKTSTPDNVTAKNNENKKPAINEKRKTFSIEDNKGKEEDLSYNEFKKPIISNIFNKNSINQSTTNSETSVGSTRIPKPIVKKHNFIINNINRFKVGNTGINKNLANGKKITSKIPQMSRKAQSTLKQNLLRMSPRIQKKPMSKNK